MSRMNARATIQQKEEGDFGVEAVGRGQQQPLLVAASVVDGFLKFSAQAAQ